MVSQYNETALMLASKLDAAEVVQALLDAGADTKARGGFSDKFVEV